MKRDNITLVVFSLILLFVLSTITLAGELIDFQTHDGYQITGKLDLPADNEQVAGVVIYVPGTGPCTYDNHRKGGGVEFNYFDLFAEQFTSRGLAFFRYNTRGTTIGNNPPWYDTVDREVFATNTPINHARDVEVMVEKLRERPKLRNAKTILLGMSEGTVVSAIVAERNQVKVDAIFLAGYENETIPETVKWQLTGGSSMIFYRQHFDADGDGVVSKTEFIEGPAEIKEQVLQGVPFEQIDQTEDDLLTEKDFKILLAASYNQVINAFENGEDDWIWNNYFRISTDWYQAHAQLEPNKTRLPKLDLPIYIFHGMVDANVPVEGVYDVKSRFEEAGKDNLHTFIFKEHDHDLNYMSWPFENTISEGLTELFTTIENFVSE